ncbi:glycine oxidase ThiO [Nitrosomonas sp.]|uniref:glycine oxidase ThiO n=1 Tax=Nitrosomonas sp. TaxID=42353 RepID=UPI0025EE28F5|nr:glycine oxidase ThiO [Nitrosomonas sp.]MCC6916048.1 glycine oxidase ThiO [Nitrosomonas sp.]
MTRTSDFVVIGAGIIGLSTALRLLEEGASVTLLDRGKIGCEASWAGGGILSPLYPWNYVTPVIQLATFSMSRYARWVAVLEMATGINPEYQTSGLVILPPYDLNTAVSWCSAHAIKLRHQPLSLISGLPGIYNDRQENTQVLFFPEIAQVRNPRLLQALCIRIRQLGGNIIEHCEIRKLDTLKHKIHTVHSAQSEFHADQYILSAGAWSKQILGKHALNLDIKPVRGQMLLYKLPEQLLHHIVLQQDFYLIPRCDGHLLAGSTVEDTGFNKQTTPEAGNMLANRAEKILPQLENRLPLKHWAGLRPATPGNLPVIGAHPYLRNLYINSGHFRYGVTMAPGSAEILLNEILKRPQPFDTTPYQQGWNFSGQSNPGTSEKR